VETLEGDPPPEKQTAAPAGNRNGGGNVKLGQAPSTPHRTRRQAILARAEALFTPEGHYHADSQVRRRQTRQELIEGHETIEITDRSFPGKLAGRRAT
jgi:hypothetical protein